MIRVVGLLLALSFFLLASGCPGDPQGDKPGDGTAPLTTATAPDAKPPSPADPLEGSIFTKEEVLEIFSAYQSTDEELRQRVLKKHRLLNARGEEDGSRTQAFDRALQRHAQADPEAWAEFLESLPH